MVGIVHLSLWNYSLTSTLCPLTDYLERRELARGQGVEQAWTDYCTGLEASVLFNSYTYTVQPSPILSKVDLASIFFNREKYLAENIRFGEFPPNHQLACTHSICQCLLNATWGYLACLLSRFKPNHDHCLVCRELHRCTAVPLPWLPGRIPRRVPRAHAALELHAHGHRRTQEHHIPRPVPHPVHRLRYARAGDCLCTSTALSCLAPLLSLRCS